MNKFITNLLIYLLSSTFATQTMTNQDNNIEKHYYCALPKNICLIYNGSPERRKWKSEDFIPYLIYHDEKAEITLPLFDAFLLIEYRTYDGKLFWGGNDEKQFANIHDWEWLAQTWHICLNELNQAVKNLKEKNLIKNNIGVIITIPEPNKNIQNFGHLPLKTQNLNFQNETDRIIAIRWYIEKIIEDFTSANYSNLTLLGFYWLGESISPDMENTVKHTADIIHQANLKFFWIPYFTANNVWAWKNLGFDYIYYQPNYFFEGNGGNIRLGMTAYRIDRFNCGVEIELDDRIFSSEIHQSRFPQYLQAGVQFRWNQKPMAWYQANDTIFKLAKSNDKKHREIYTDIALFINQTYQPPKTLPPIQEYKNPPRTGHNIAHRHNGTKVIKPLPSPQLPLNPEWAIDGDIDCYSGTSGFLWCEIPGEIIIQFAGTFKITRVQMLLFNLDERYYQYKIDTSQDGNTWKTIVDKSKGKCRGWQVDTFAPHPARYLRIVPLFNSTGQNLFQIVELEVY